MQTSAHISAFMRCASWCFIPRPFDLFVACGWVPKHVKTSQDKFDLTRIKALDKVYRSIDLATTGASAKPGALGGLLAIFRKNCASSAGGMSGKQSKQPACLVGCPLSGAPLSPRGRAPRSVCQRSDEGVQLIAAGSPPSLWRLAAPPDHAVAGLVPENRPPMATSTLSSTTPATMPLAMSTA